MPHIARNDLSVDEVLRQVSYDPHTGKFTRLTKGSKPISEVPNANGYLRVRINGISYKAHRLAWLCHYGEWPTNNVDHINGDRTDNRIANLRDVPHVENQRNMRVHRERAPWAPAKVRFPKRKGTVWLVRDGGWAASYKRKYVGYFTTRESAEIALARHIAEADSPSTGITMADENIIAHFFVDAIVNNFESEKQGRPIHEDREFIRIFIAGDKLTEVVREATAHDKDRFREQYRRFKDGMAEDAQIVGTRLSAWPAMTPALIRDFEGMNIRTVDQLAAMSDTALQSIGMGGLEWRAKAKAFLEVAERGATASHYAAELERKTVEIEELRQQVRDLASRIPADEERRGPGRPRKDAA